MSTTCNRPTAADSLAAAPHAHNGYSRYGSDGATTVRYAHSLPDRTVYFADDPFPAPRPFDRTSRTVRRKAAAMGHKSTVGVIAMVAAVALAVCALGLALSFANFGTQDAAQAPTSTPKRDWQAGQVPYLYQTDATWADYGYAGGSVRENGCGPTCLSMAYVALTGKTDRDPASMAAFSQLSGYVDAEGNTLWALMDEGAARLGLKSASVPADISSLRAELLAGHPVIASVGPGDFTTEGHFIVLVGIDDNDQLAIRDPNSVERSNVTWDGAKVLSQCRSLWALSA